MFDPSERARTAGREDDEERFQREFIATVESMQKGELVSDGRRLAAFFHVLAYFLSGYKSVIPDHVMRGRLAAMTSSGPLDRAVVAFLDILKSDLGVAAGALKQSVVDVPENPDELIHDWPNHSALRVSEAMNQKGLETLLSVFDVRDEPDVKGQEVALVLHRFTDPEQIKGLLDAAAQNPDASPNPPPAVPGIPEIKA